MARRMVAGVPGLSKKHPLAIAWNQWAKSNPESLIASTLGVKEPDMYLQNRLAGAFNAGAEAQRQNYLRALASVDSSIETGTAVPIYEFKLLEREVINEDGIRGI